MAMRTITFLFISLIFTRSAFAGNGSDTGQVMETRKATLNAVTMDLEDDHFSTPRINDTYSRMVWKRFLSTLDRDKDVYLLTDIRRLQTYDTQIDDEMHASSTAFFDTAVGLYKTRLSEIMKIYSKLLDRPLAAKNNLLSIKEGNSIDFPANNNDRDRIWQRRIRIQVLNKLVELQAFDSTSSFQQLEKKAREKVLQALNTKFHMALSSAGEDDQFSQYINVITSCVDPHTTYFPPLISRSVTEQLSRRYFGLGMELNVADGPVIIQRLFPGGNAFKSGLLRVYDRIVGVSNEKGEMTDVSEMSSTEVTRMIRGDKGTSVRLLIDRPGSGRSTVELERGEIIDQQTGIRSAIISRGGMAWGYIYLPEFYEDVAKADGPHCARDIAEKVKELIRQGAKGLVFDLRNNPGGSLNEVVQMAALFIPTGPVVQLKGKGGIQGMGKYGDTAKAIFAGPMTVLVNESSASASEIFAAAMQDYRRAVIIGSPTFGKGTAQESRALGKIGDKRKGIPNISYGSIRLTTKKFYRITGDATQLKGVIPDVIIPDGREYLPIREKDGFAPLEWDHIEALPFSPCPMAGYENAVSKAITRVSRDSALVAVSQQTAWLKEHAEGPFPLDFQHYRKEMAAIKTHRQQLEILLKLPVGQGLDFHGMEQDSSTSSSASGPISARPGLFQQQDAALSRDVTLMQALKVLEDMTDAVKKE
ncbi:carboxy terminal-processing peptidase [Flavitalea flava]